MRRPLRCAAATCRVPRAPRTHLREHSQVEIAPFDAAVCSGKSGVLVADQRIYGSILAFRVRPEMRLGAARYFALPSEFINGPDAGGRVPIIPIRSLAEAAAVNASLPRGARFISADQRGAYVNALFRLTERPGPGGGCGSGTGPDGAHKLRDQGRPHRGVDPRAQRPGGDNQHGTVPAQPATPSRPTLEHPGAPARRSERQARGGGVSSQLDVRDEQACVDAATATAERAGSLEVWVNNAGALVTGLAWEQPSEVRQPMLEVNALGTINGTLATLELMRPAGRGHVVSVVSLAGIVAAPGRRSTAPPSTPRSPSASARSLISGSLASATSTSRACAPTGSGRRCFTTSSVIRQPPPRSRGVLLQPAQVASHVGRILDHPRPVVTVPRWRGAMVRAFDAWPRLALHGVGPVIAYGRLQQRRFKRKLESGRWPPRGAGR